MYSTIMKRSFLCIIFLGSSVFAAPTSNANPSKFKLWQMPTPLSLICEVTDGPDGNEWGQEILGDNLVYIDPVTDQAVEYPIPFTLPVLTNVTLPLANGVDRPAVPCAMESGLDGFLYASNGLRNQMVQMNVTSKKMVIFTAPNILGNAYPLDDMTPAPDGMYYTQSTGNTITKFDYVTHQFTSYQVPTPASIPIGIFYASDGGIWFLEFAASKLGRFDRTTHQFQEYQLPVALLGPQVIRAETQGRYLWFTGFLGGSLGRVDMQTRNITAYPIPETADVPVEVCADENENIWFTSITRPQLGKFDPKTETFSFVETPGALPIDSALMPYVGNGISCLPGNNVWFSQSLYNTMGRYSIVD